MVKVLIKKLNPAVEIPNYKTTGASGMDLVANNKKKLTIKSGTSAIIPTGIAIAIPKNYEVQIRPRSGLAANKSISVLNTPGTIDSDYRGEIKIILINLGKKSFVVRSGDRIAQMILSPVAKANLSEVKNLPKTMRGKRGFGSTGK